MVNDVDGVGDSGRAEVETGSLNEMAAVVTRDRSRSDRPLLRVRDLEVRFPTDRGMVHAVNGASFDLHEGRALGIVGESGSGKSVLAKALMNLLPRTAQVGGEMNYDGQDLRTMAAADARHFWGVKMTMVLQDPMTSLHPAKKIGEQVAEILRYHLGRSRRDAKDEAVDLLEWVGVPEPRARSAQYPHELSGGLRQRTAIAMALACRPRLLIADEPTTAVDVTVQKRLLDLLDRLRSESGMAMILITHDLGVARHTDEVAVMYAGRVVEQAAPGLLFSDMRHPYTEALLHSIPRMSHPSHHRFDPIPGRPSEQIDPPDSCSFAQRCRYAQPDCLQGLPQLVVGQEDGHRFACGYPAGTARGARARAANRAAGVTVAGLAVGEVASSAAVAGLAVGGVVEDAAVGRGVSSVGTRRAAD